MSIKLFAKQTLLDLKPAIDADLLPERTFKDILRSLLYIYTADEDIATETRILMLEAIATANLFTIMGVISYATNMELIVREAMTNRTIDINIEQLNLPA